VLRGIRLQSQHLGREITFIFLQHSTVEPLKEIAARASEYPDVLHCFAQEPIPVRLKEPKR
jgi:hypothetical protein